MATKKVQSTKSSPKKPAKPVAKSVSKTPTRSVSHSTQTTNKNTSAEAKTVSQETPKNSAKPANKFDKNKFVTNIRKPQILIPLAILLAVVAIYLLKSFFVVALVNGQFITRPAFESAMEKQAGKQTLNTLVTQVLLEQEASKKGISVPQSDISNQEKKIDQQLATQGQTLDQALQARGMTRADLEQQLKLQTLLQKLLADKIKVSDKDVQDYIDKNKDSLPTGESDSQLKDSVKQQLEQQKLSTAAQDLIQKLQQQAHITYFINL